MVFLLVALTIGVFLIIYPMARRWRQQKFLQSLEIAEPVLTGYRFTPGHLWLNQLQSGHFHLGLDEVILRFVGEPDKIHLIEPGELVKAGEPLAILCKGDKEIYIRAPFAATIIKTNHRLVGRAQTINCDLYRRCWLYQIDLTDAVSQLGTLLRGDRARTWINRELVRLKEFVVSNQLAPALVSNTLLDGGELINGVIDHLGLTAVDDFEKQFLTEDFREQDKEKK